MKNFIAIYRILNVLECALDIECFDESQFSYNPLQMSEIRFIRLLELLVEEWYVRGIEIKYSIDGSVTVEFSNPRITLIGLSYLHNDSDMQKARECVRGER